MFVLWPGERNGHEKGEGRGGEGGGGGLCKGYVREGIGGPFIFRPQAH